MDCAIALRELERLSISDIITFDVYDSNVSNAISHLPFESFYPTNVILYDFIDKELNDISNLLVISPDIWQLTELSIMFIFCGVTLVFFTKMNANIIVNINMEKSLEEYHKPNKLVLSKMKKRKIWNENFIFFILIKLIFIEKII